MDPHEFDPMYSSFTRNMQFPEGAPEVCVAAVLLCGRAQPHLAPSQTTVNHSSSAPLNTTLGPHLRGDAPVRTVRPLLYLQLGWEQPRRRMGSAHSQRTTLCQALCLPRVCGATAAPGSRRPLRRQGAPRCGQTHQVATSVGCAWTSSQTRLGCQAAVAVEVVVVVVAVAAWWAPTVCPS